MNSPRSVEELMALLYASQYAPGRQRGAEGTVEPGSSRYGPAARRAQEVPAHALRTAHLLRRSHPADKELQIAGLLRAIVPPPEGAALRELLGERVAALVRLTGEDAQPLRQAEEESAGLELDAGVLEDWRPVLELVAAAHRAPAGR